MTRQYGREHGTQQPKRKRRPRRRLRLNDSKITAPVCDSRGRIVGHKVIFEGNDTKANRLWSVMIEVSGVLSMPREGK